MTASGYIHSYSDAEQDRLLAQADYLARYHHTGLDFSGCRRVLEVGCGVGAQMRQVLARWPEACVTGVDVNESQLDKAKIVLRDAIATGRALVQPADGAALPFPPATFDAVYVFWVFEHLADPLPILRDINRVLCPGGRLFVTEVVDRAVYAHPNSPGIAAYFRAFVQLQAGLGGDPDAGLRIAGLAALAGFDGIELRDVSPMLDARMTAPAERSAFLDYFQTLLLSGADQLLASRLITNDLIAGLKSEFAALRDDPRAVFHYGAKQLAARKR